MIFLKYKIYLPNYIILVFDYGKKNFRNKIYKYYKSNRKNTPNYLLNYIFYVKKKLNLLNIKFLSIKNVESDDTISSLVYKINNIYKNKCKIYILSYDKDFFQLIKKNVFLLRFNKEIYTEIDVFKKYGIYPNLIKDLFALCGDSSDNIPGIKGIGIKTAIILLKNIGCINKIYKNLNKIKNLNIKNYSNIIYNLKKKYKEILIWLKLIKLKNNIKININMNNFFIKKKFFNKFFYNLFKYK